MVAVEHVDRRTIGELSPIALVAPEPISANPDWHVVWQELRCNAARQSRVQTLIKKVTNEIIAVDEAGLTVKSSQTERERFVSSAQFEVISPDLRAPRARALITPVPKPLVH